MFTKQIYLFIFLNPENSLTFHYMLYIHNYIVHAGIWAVSYRVYFHTD